MFYTRDQTCKFSKWYFPGFHWQIYRLCVLLVWLVKAQPDCL